MSMTRVFRGLGTAMLATAVWGCHSLEVSNPNDPDKNTALSDPVALEALGGGAFRTFFNAYNSLRGAGTLSTMARTYSASWNNGNMNFYSGVDIAASDVTTSPATWTRNSRGYQNDPAFAGRTTVDAFWAGGLDESATPRPGFYGALSAANSALFAIRVNSIVVGSASRTRRLEAVSQLIQGMVHGMLALNYDKALIVNENTNVEAATFTYSNRRIVRDSAIVMLQRAITLANANSFTTDAAWTNSGPTYSNTDIAKIANTFAAMVLAWYPRDATEAATVNWATVESFAAAGMSSGATPVNLSYLGDGYDNWVSELMSFGLELLDGGRLHTRVGHFLDPATQRDPFPLGSSDPQPNSLDRRVGDGSFGDTDLQDYIGTVPVTVNGGTDFAWSEVGEVFRPDRGFYHQSHMTHVRYDASGNHSSSDIYGGFGVAPVINASVNDLIWAEALIRQGGAAKLAQAAGLINKTRVTRGGLSDALGFVGSVGAPTDGPCMSDGRLARNGAACTLWSILLYENEIELLGLGPAPYYNQRHLPVVLGGGAFDGSVNRYIQGLIPGTPREMPVPYRELGVKGEALYTFGGTGAPNSAPPP